MKKILITGANSYIGISFENYMKQWPDKYQVDTVDMIDGSWRQKDFSGYDVVYHVAGIAHIKETKENCDLYYKVNRDLPFEVAQKAKTEGVKHFIFLSSMSVYGLNVGRITKDTEPVPNTNYGKSKYQAEGLLKPLADNNFKIAVIRPPMIYGKGCKGNYNALVKMATKLPCFPYVNNQRSMLYISNLVEFIRLLVENEDAGLFFPQNAEHTNTSEMVKAIANAHGKRICVVKGFGWALKLFGLFTEKVNKAFGSLTYDMKMSEYKCEYRVKNLNESIEDTEI